MTQYKLKIQQKGLKKNWLAQQIGIPRTTFSAYICGKRTMPNHVEVKLDQLLK